MLKNIFIFSFSIFLFTSCATKNLSQSDLQNIVKKQNTYDICTNFSYISLEDDPVYGKIFTEFVSLKDYCKWNGDARGFFVTQFMDSIKANSYKVVDKKEFSGVEFTIYLVDNEFYVDVIDEFSVFSDRLMIDYSGVYATKLRQNFEPTYQNSYLSMKRLDSSYFDSLVRQNFFKFYFSRDSVGWR